VLIYVANWPEPRIQAWDALLKARAIENMAYCIGVNRVGSDPNGHHYVGHSNAYDPLGNALLTLPEVEARASIRLDKNEMQSLREKLNFLDDRDHFNLII
jgi:predicted amidohydrolase